MAIASAVFSLIMALCAISISPIPDSNRLSSTEDEASLYMARMAALAAAIANTGKV